MQGKNIFLIRGKQRKQFSKRSKTMGKQIMKLYCQQQQSKNKNVKKY